MYQHGCIIASVIHGTSLLLSSTIFYLFNIDIDQKSTIQHLIIVSAASPSMAFARWDVHADVVATKLTKIRDPVHVELHCQTWRSLEIRRSGRPGALGRITGSLKKYTVKASCCRQHQRPSCCSESHIHCQKYHCLGSSLETIQ
jgi:hypothetical protein